VLAVIGLVLTVGIANATVPDPDLCSVLPCDTYGVPAGSAPGIFMYPDPVPDGLAKFTVNVRNADDDPIPDAFVEILIGVPGNHHLCPDVVLTGTTDANGDVDFNISAGGCTIGANAVIIRANGVDIRDYDYLKSADFSPVDGQTELADFIAFGTQYASSAPGCTDFFNDGTTELTDFVAFGEAWGRACPVD
jgi:hypothetical protein